MGYTHFAKNASSFGVGVAAHTADAITDNVVKVLTISIMVMLLTPVGSNSN